MIGAAATEGGDGNGGTGDSGVGVTVSEIRRLLSDL